MSSPILVARGDQGDSVLWESDFSEIETALVSLQSLENIENGQNELKSVVKDLPYFSSLLELDFPPLYNESDLDCLDGFYVDIEEPEEEKMFMSFNTIEVRIIPEMKSDILTNFRLLNQRLTNVSQEKS